MDVKVGDVVHVRGTVLANDETGVLVDCRDDLSKFEISTRARVAPDKIVHIESRPLRVGDKVDHCMGMRGEIVCIADKYLWIRTEKYGLGTYRADEWKRV